MQARISLSEPALKRNVSQPSADEASFSDDPRHLEALIRAGIVTHRFKSPERLDLMFATGALYDLPEIAFVAAFKFGTLYIGCPNGPPESIAELIDPVAPAPAPKADAEIQDEMNRAEEMTTRLEKVVQAMNTDQVHQVPEKDSSVTDDAQDPSPERSPETMENANLSHADAPIDLKDATNAPSQTEDTPIEQQSDQENQSTGTAIDSEDDNARPEPENTRSEHEDALDAAFCEERPEEQQVIALEDDASGTDDEDGGVKDDSAENNSAPNGDPTDDSANDANPGEGTTEDLLTSASVPTSQNEPHETELPSDELSDRLSVIAADITEIRTHQNEQNAAISRLSDALSQLGDANGDTQAAGQTQQLADELAALASLARTAAPEVMRGLSTLSAMQQQINDAADTKAAANDDTHLSDALESIEIKVQSLRDDIQKAAEQTHANGIALEQQNKDEWAEAITQKLDGLAEKTATLSSDTDADILEQLRVLKEQLHSLSDTFTAAPQPFEAMETALGNLRQDVKRLAAVPKPVLDLTEQRRSFATFTTAVSAITQRLEATADQIGTHLKNDDSAKAMDAVLERLDALPAQIKAELPPPPDVAKIESRLDILDAKLAKADAPLEDLSARLEVLQTSAQSDATEIKAAMTKLDARLDEIATAPVDFSPVLENLITLQEQTDQLPGAISAMQTKIEAIANRPAPTLDLSAQREGFARFAIASARVIDRLEKSADNLHTLRDETKGDTQEIKTLLQSLTSDIQNATQGKPDEPAVQETLARLQGDIDVLPAALGELETLRNTMNMLAKRPDPVIDLTEQRKSFARFVAVMSASVQRLEHAATALDDASAKSGENEPMLECLQALRTQIDALALAQTDQLTSLTHQIAALAADTPQKTALPVEDSPHPGPAVQNQMSAEDIRFMFAEFVASQIQSTHPPAPRNEPA